MTFKVQTVSCLPTGQCGDQELENNPPECVDPLYAADNPTICVDENGNVVTILRLRINPTTGSVETSKQYPFRAILVFSDGREKDMTDDVAWTSANDAVATIEQAGFATGVAIGSTSIGASFRTYTATAQLEVVAPCTTVSGVDFCLVIDRSGSMQEVSPAGVTRMRGTLQAAIGFARSVNYTTDQVAVTSFSGILDETSGAPVYEVDTTTNTTLTNNEATVEAAINSISPDWGSCIHTDANGRRRMQCLTFIFDGLQLAYDILTGPGANPSATKCVILLTDGANNGPCSTDPEDIAATIRVGGMALVVISVGVPDGYSTTDCSGGAVLVKTWLASLTNCSLYFDAATADELPDIFARVPRLVCGVSNDPCLDGATPDPCTVPFSIETYSNTDDTAARNILYSVVVGNPAFFIYLGDGNVVLNLNSALPSGFSYNPSTRVLQGVFSDPAMYGDYPLEFTGGNACGTETFTTTLYLREFPE